MAKMGKHRDGCLWRVFLGGDSVLGHGGGGGGSESDVWGVFVEVWEGK